LQFIEAKPADVKNAEELAAQEQKAADAAAAEEKEGGESS
jgi:hypothetical protein